MTHPLIQPKEVKKSTGLYLEQSLYDDLAELAGSNNLSFNEVCRRILSGAMAEYKAEQAQLKEAQS